MLPITINTSHEKGDQQRLNTCVNRYHKPQATSHDSRNLAESWPSFDHDKMVNPSSMDLHVPFLVRPPSLIAVKVAQKKTSYTGTISVFTNGVNTSTK